MFPAVAAVPVAAVLPVWQSLLLLVPVIVAGVGSLLVRPSREPQSADAADPVRAWKWARGASAVMLAAAAGLAVARLMDGDRANSWVRFDSVGVIMCVLVSFVGWVIVRYSQAYLAGDPHQRRYLGKLLATIASVLVVVLANNLVLLAVAWTITSLVLHGLLTFYRDRPVAVVVAHKKFILARCADLCMLGAIVAFGTTFQTLRIDEIAIRAAAGSLPAGGRIGIILLALAALLKCAQVPFHGWLIQVMEAPTPVSALLHAGVVNLGGFVLLRFAPVVDKAFEVRALLVSVGTVTAVVAAVVMTTRISIKVSLAWSTCAQMGFMLMQCGLGLWEMALLHIVAHSLYKAHAFLGAGGTVRAVQRKQLSQTPRKPTWAMVATGLSLGIAGTVAAGWIWSQLSDFTTASSTASSSATGSSARPSSLTMVLLGAIVSMSLVPLLNGGGSQTAAPTRRLIMLVSVFAVPFGYFGLHTLFARVVPHGSSAPNVLLVSVGLGFAALFAMQMLCSLSPNSAVARRLYPWFYGGLFLDEAFTRVVFAVWPPPSPEPRMCALPVLVTSPVSAAWAPGADSNKVQPIARKSNGAGIGAGSHGAPMPAREVALEGTRA